ncbi:MAG TPA: glycine zipper family protein [Stellaceae bacterium]|nr:glycine zipper family protein [Stellaceae bacterium]
MRAKLTLAVLLVGSLSLAACGQTPGCRALTGAGVGAAGGAVIGAIAGHPATGAIAGAAGGALLGGLSSPSSINGPSPCY